MTWIARHMNPFRIASYLLGFYTLGHTLGAVVNVPRFGLESDAVVAAMTDVHVRAQGADCTWYGFYRGFGVFVSVFLVFSSVLAWRLGAATDKDREALRFVAWALLASQIGGLAAAWAYFFPAPTAFSTAICAFLAIGIARDLRRPQEGTLAAS